MRSLLASATLESLLLLALATNAGATPLLAAPSSTITPEVPVFIDDLCDTPARCLGDVALVREETPGSGYDFTQGTIPAYRTSADGRVGLDVRLFDGMVQFVLLRPEALDAPVQRGAPGAGIVASPIQVPPTSFHDRMVTLRESTKHHTICDATSQFPALGDDTNPKPCHDDPSLDCYDLAVVSTVRRADDDFQLWSTPTEVRVANPKTADAKLVSVTPGTPVAGPVFAVSEILEPMITSDGRLLVARLGNTRYAWEHPDTGVVITQSTDIVYAVYPETVDGLPTNPCDVSRWTDFHPISHAPYDPVMTARYGIARYPFRDAFGQLIPDGEDLRVTYPWIDRDGDNLFFEAVGATLYYDDAGTVRERYESACVTGYACTFPQVPGDLGDYEATAITTRGVSFAGLWSHGKMVLLDERFNNTDFGLYRPGEAHRMLRLYAPSAQHDGWIRTGTGRDNGTDGSHAPSSTTNTALIDSLENLFNHDPDLFPLTVRDVVWLVNTGKASAEVAFDDYLDPNGFIVADMTAALSFDAAESRLLYHDGFEQTGKRTGSGFTLAPRFQNAASALPTDWVVPQYGLAHGNVRVEPVALGGIEGKGLWMDGDTEDGLEFRIAAQPQATGEVDWYVGMFLDARFPDDGVARVLFTFPDGSRIVLRGRHQLGYVDAAGVPRHGITLPAGALPEAAWSHLGFIVREAGHRVDFYLDGFAYDRRTGAVPLFRIQPGSFYVGGAAPGELPGVRGWVDELRVLARDPGPEVACNLARGTLIGLEAQSDPAWTAIAASYPAAAHAAITGALPAGFGHPRYACYRDYDDPLNAHLGNLPADTFEMRSLLLFPEGPLVHDLARPDSTANAFCTSCHVIGRSPELGLEALVPAPIAMEDDPRRQPMQAPRLLFGNIPADFLESGPGADEIAPPEGWKLDPWVHP